MKTLLCVSLFLLLATGAPAQRRGGGFSGGRGSAGHSISRGGGHYGGSYSGGSRYGGGYSSGSHYSRGYAGGRIGGGYIGGRVGSSWHSGYRGYSGWSDWGYRSYGYWPYGWGVSLGYWPSYYGFGYGWGWDDPVYYDAYPVVSPRVTVVYPDPAPVPRSTVTVVNRVEPGVRQYDQWGQEIGAPPPAVSHIYLIAFRDGVIRAAVSYRVDGATLHYTLEGNQERSAPLDTVDRERSLQLNRERRVPFRLP